MKNICESCDHLMPDGICNWLSNKACCCCRPNPRESCEGYKEAEPERGPFGTPRGMLFANTDTEKLMEFNGIQWKEKRRPIRKRFHSHKNGTVWKKPMALADFFWTILAEWEAWLLENFPEELKKARRETDEA